MTNKNQKYYYIITYGCQMNEHDSEQIAGMLENIGYQQTDKLEKADFIFLNTCTIRENAANKVFGKVGSLKQYKRKNPDLIIGIGGCMMQTESALKKINQSYPQVDLVIGTHNLQRLPQLLQKIESENNKIYEVWDKEDGLLPELPQKRENDFQAWVTIIRGCNNFCSYCIVPYVRGRERSRSQTKITNEIKDLVKDGVKEITLLGQNVNSYGKDLEEEIDFADLLQKVDTITNLPRIRYMTSHPRDFNQKLIETIKNSENVCEHFHLPVQSGSTKILRKMNRGYSRQEYINLVETIKHEIPQASITTDIIVGFPGESDEDFKKTLDLVNQLKFDMAFTFSYSQRKGTPASKMEDQVNEDIKNERLHQLMELQNEISKKQNQKLKNNIVEILVEGESKNNPETYAGRSRTNKLVIIPKDEKLLGKIVKVKINQIHSWTLYGEKA